MLVTFATGLISPNQSKSGPIDLREHFARIRRIFSVVFSAHACFMWFDGPLFTEQAVFGTVGIMHIPIIAATLVPGVSGNNRANAVAASTAIAVLLVVMAVRYSTA